MNVRKRDLSRTALHAIALETINTRFPPEEWLHIYTNGSLLDFAQGAGIGVFSHLFSFYLHAGPLTTHFDDSTSALQALSNYNENNCLHVQNCRELLGKIKGKIVFQWVPSHCGLWGNERADFLAKKGTSILQNFRRDLTLHSAKLEIKRIFRESFRLTASRVARDKPWSTLCKKSHGIPSSRRAAAVAKFRLLTGYDSLWAHLFRFNLVTSPICVLCDTGQDMTAAHLDECSALNDLNCIVKSHKIPPAYLLFGTLPYTPPLAQNQVYPPVEEDRRLAKENTIKYHEKNKIKYDARFIDSPFEPGDIVIYEEFNYPNRRKLSPIFSGPYEIVQKLSGVNYEITKPNAVTKKPTKIVHVSKLRTYYPPEELKLSHE
ncbi:transposon Ty3-I Gag-Pol polyprotein [Trichonephila clavipes]|nr:transposon Ty3-I Gag-Pol polyprotein [Trichonephila clavipes]